MSAVVYFAHGARVRVIWVAWRGAVLLSAIDNKRLSQTDVWHYFWHRGGFLGTVFGTNNGMRIVAPSGIYARSKQVILSVMPVWLIRTSAIRIIV